MAAGYTLTEGASYLMSSDRMDKAISPYPQERELVKWPPPTKLENGFNHIQESCNVHN